MRRLVLLFVLAAMLPASVWASVTPHALFSNNAVLQQGMPVPVWGWANDGEKVTVKFQGQTVSTVASGGKWMVKLQPLGPGGPFTMTISGDNTVELKNILVGEVWVCSGQSNMDMHLDRTENADAVIADSRDYGMHWIGVPMKWSDEPQVAFEASWQVCRPDMAGRISAVAYYFGRELRRDLKTPVGLIQSAVGGTRSEWWTPKAAMQSDPALAQVLEADQKDLKGEYRRSTVLYNGMIAPLQPFAIRGAIWYQGEGNAGDAYRYRRDFPIMIKSWRQEWGQGDFPFLFVQLAPFQKIADQPEDAAWAVVRESQLLTTTTCPNTAMAVITDAGDSVDIHPKKKEPAGVRLALAARHMVYGENMESSGPLYRSMKVKGGSIILSFDHTAGGLAAKDGDLKGFAIAGEDKKFVWAQAKIDGDRVVVSSPQVPHPAAVRYGWADCPVVNLYNRAGLPASPFRTDTWPVVTQGR